jgi:hypothetical protein
MSLASGNQLSKEPFKHRSLGIQTDWKVFYVKIQLVIIGQLELGKYKDGSRQDPNGQIPGERQHACHLFSGSGGCQGW